MKFSFYFKHIKSKLLMKIIVFSLVCILFSAFILSYFSSLNTIVNVKAEESVNVVILMYHSVLKSSNRQGDYVITPNDFEQDLQYITQNGYQTIFVSDLINYVYDGTPLPDKPMILSFDDGYYNNYLYAFPLLKKYNCKMVFSPIAKCSETYSSQEDENAIYSHTTWTELSEMVSSGLVEIANHSYNMHTNAARKGANEKKGESYQQYKSVLCKDVETAQQLLSQNVGITPSCFTYPFGAYCCDSTEILKELGFKATLICEEKINSVTKGDTESIYNLGRYLRPGKTSSSKFFSSKKL